MRELVEALLLFRCRNDTLARIRIFVKGLTEPTKPCTIHFVENERGLY